MWKTPFRKSDHICIIYIICTFTDKIFKVYTSTSSFRLPVVKKKNIGLKSPKAGHRPALGYTNTKRNEI